MNVRQVRVHDLVRKVNTGTLGVVDRTDKEVSSHVPEPQADYLVEVGRHRSVSKNDYKTFMRLGKPPPRTALVFWNFGTSVELISTRFLEVVNRTIEPGEVVKKVGESRSAMSGIVLQREVFHKLGVINADNPLPAVANGQPNLRDGLERCFPHRLENVSGNDIIYSRPYLRGDIVVYQGWFGDVYDVFEEIVIWFSDGRIIALEDPSGIQPLRPEPICVAELLDVGYVVKVPTSYISSKGRVLSSRDRASVPRSADPTFTRGVVLKINVNSIGVNWRGRKLGEVGPINHPHPLLDLTAINRNEVRVYSFTGRPHSTHSIAGRMDAEYSLGTYVTFRDDESYKRCSQVITETPAQDENDSESPEHKLKFNAFVVIGVSSRVTVRWQDQSISTHASKDLLADEEFEDEHEQWPCSLVVPNPPSSPSGIWRPSRVGVVQSVVSSDRIAQVLWKDTQEIEYLTGPKSQLVRLPRSPQSPFPLIQQPQGSTYPEETSLYDIVQIPEMSFQILDLVMVIPLPDQEFSSTPSEATYDWIGQVMETRLDGMVVVRLGALNTIEDRVYPPDRLHFIMSRGDILDLAEGSPATSEEDSEVGESPEDGQPSSTVPLAIWYENDQGERIYPVSSEDDGWSTAGDSTIADDDEMQDGSLMDESGGETEHVAQAGGGAQANHFDSNEPRHQFQKSLEEDADFGTAVVKNTPEQASDSSSRVPKPRRLSIRGGPASFDILGCEPPTSHAFYGDDAESLTGSQLRRIHKEHSILSTSLPEGVYVRSWESRLDLFRVLIIGPPDTPYEFAPFMIDFRLPSTFPNNPPDAFFHSWNAGSPINPNLYQDGKICLSLLNTWNGTNKSEEWSPKESTLYQVLVSIQSLVLVKEPYYNEAGYDALVGADEAAVPSRQYSEWVYFSSREYIKKMVECKFEPFEEVAEWLYRSNGPNAPKLLHGSIEAIKDILGSDGRRQQFRGGLMSVSKGALPKFKRQLEMLQSLVDSSNAMQDVVVDVASRLTEEENVQLS